MAVALATLVGSARAWFRILAASRFLHSHHGSSLPAVHDVSADTATVWLLIPVFHEQERIAESLEYFAAFAAAARPLFHVKVVVITTAREDLAVERGEQSARTWEVMDRAVAALDADAAAPPIRRVHYPNRSGWKPHQLNHAVRLLASELRSGSPADVLIGVYDVDARPTMSTIASLAAARRRDRAWPEFAQQLSIYHPASPASRWGLIGALWQTRWTLSAETAMLRRSGPAGRAGSLSWCIGNGLFLRLDAYRLLGGFSERFYTEDLEFGYRLALLRKRIRLVGGFVQASCPSDPLSDIAQKARWFTGILDYPRYASGTSLGSRRHRWWLSAVGLARGALWLSVAPLMLALFGAPLARGLDLVGITCILGGAMFTCGGTFATLLAVDSLPGCALAAEAFALGKRVWAILLAPIYVVGHSLGPYLSLGRRLARLARGGGRHVA